MTSPRPRSPRPALTGLLGFAMLGLLGCPGSGRYAGGYPSGFGGGGGTYGGGGYSGYGGYGGGGYQGYGGYGGGGYGGSGYSPYSRGSSGWGSSPVGWRPTTGGWGSPGSTGSVDVSGFRQGLNAPRATPTRRTPPDQAPVPWSGIGGGGTRDPGGTPLVDTSQGSDPYQPRPGWSPGDLGPADDGGAGQQPSGQATPPQEGRAPTTPAEVQREIMRMRAMRSVDGSSYSAVDPVEFFVPQGRTGGSFNPTSAVVLGLRPQDAANPSGFYDYGPDGNPVPASLTAVDLVGGGRGHVVQASNPTPETIQSAVPG